MVSKGGKEARVQPTAKESTSDLAKTTIKKLLMRKTVETPEPVPPSRPRPLFAQAVMITDGRCLGYCKETRLSNILHAVKHATYRL
jgi:hypothetical protein